MQQPPHIPNRIFSSSLINNYVKLIIIDKTFMQRYVNSHQPTNFPKLIEKLTFQPNPTIKKRVLTSLSRLFAKYNEKNNFYQSIIYIYEQTNLVISFCIAAFAIGFCSFTYPISLYGITSLSFIGTIRQKNLGVLLSITALNKNTLSLP